MRQLNKIVFINSATIRYEEVLLDGNIHFIGTQGVGKSTVLRAILFFYNGDTQKLGIPREKKIFAEYYFPNTNSYILYEVQRENGPFTVLVMRSGSGVIFRFIDAAYDRKWMLRDNQPLESWGGIRQELDKQGIDSSNLINRLIEYRNIIYGSSEVQPAYRKYALLESKQYQNIPRTITNVFLNARLEASFIKETIIQSLSEEELQIDLMTYRHHLHDFEKEFEDITTFKQPKTQELAEKLICDFNQILQRQTDRLQTAARLGASLKRGEKELDKLKALLHKSLQKQKEEHQKHAKRENRKQHEIARLRGDIKSIEAKIREAQKKERAYREQDIVNVLKRYRREQEWKNAADQLKNERAALTTKFESLDQQFKVLRQQVQNKIDQLKTTRQQQQQKIRQEMLDQQDKLRLDRDEQLQKLQGIHEAKLEDLEKQEEMARQRFAELREQKATSEERQWRGKEIQALKDDISASKNLVDEKGLKIKIERKNRQHLRGEWEREEEKLKEEKERRLQRLKARQDDLTMQLTGVESKLARHHDALYGYLEEHYSDWRDTIGRVAREEVLFDENLEPSLKEKSSLFFGVKLNLEGLKVVAKSLEDYKSEKESVQKQLEEGKKDLIVLEKKLSGDLDRLAKRLKPKVREISDRIQRLEIEHQQMQEKVQRGRLQLEVMERAALAEKDRALNKLDKSLNEASRQLQSQQNLVQQQKDHWKKEQNKIRSAMDKKVRELEKEKEDVLEDIYKRFKAELKETEVHLKELKQQQHQKLHAAGADMPRLTELDEQLAKVKAELQFIEEKRELVIEYRKDKRELFDLMEKFKMDREKVVQKLELAEGQLQEIQSQHKKDLYKITDAINQLKEQIRKLEEGFDEFEQFSSSEIYMELESQVQTSDERGDAFAVRKYIQEIWNFSQKLNKLRENLGVLTNRFLNRFSEANLFRFPTQLSSAEDYLRFADELKEFIDENKIAEFESRVNRRFASILHSISKETESLLRRESDIQKVVTSINRDFRERNFVGVIQSMELKIEDSADRVVNTLKRIREYEQERGFALGERNLFNYGDGEEHNKRAVEFLRQLYRDIIESKREQVALSDAFELRFRVVENENDSGWVEKLSNVGSEGTDVLVKAMINILLLNVFKESASRKFKSFRLHCMMDEVGRLHPTNVRGILKFANDRNIMLINGSPVEHDAMAYRHIYELRKDSKSRTRIKRLITVRKQSEATA